VVGQGRGCGECAREDYSYEQTVGLRMGTSGRPWLTAKVDLIWNQNDAKTVRQTWLDLIHSKAGPYTLVPFSAQPDCLRKMYHCTLRRQVSAFCT